MTMGDVGLTPLERRVFKIYAKLGGYTAARVKLEGRVRELEAELERLRRRLSAVERHFA